MNDLEETPIYGEVPPQVDLPSLPIPIRVPDPFDRLLALVQAGDGTIPEGDGTRCGWDDQQVDREGETCSFGCYVSWYGWYYLMQREQNQKLAVLQPDEPAPLPLEEQPWYRRML